MKKTKTIWLPNQWESKAQKRKNEEGETENEVTISLKAEVIKNSEKCFKNYSASSTHLKIVLSHAQGLGNDFHPPWS